MSRAIRKLIVPSAEADSIHALAITEGMTPITQAAVRLARPRSKKPGAEWTFLATAGLRCLGGKSPL